MSIKKEWIITHYYDLAYENKVPVQVQIELLTKCNLRCKHCYLPEHDSYGMSTEEIKDLLMQLRELGTASVTFTGGEIFLREDLIELVKYARRLYMRVSLLSNATYMTETQIEQLSRLSITDISTTMFSDDSSIHDGITGVSGSLAKLKNNLLLLKKYNIPVLVKMPLMRFNYMCLDAVEEYCKINEFSFSASPLIYYKTDGDSGPSSFRIEKEELRKVVKKLDELENYIDNHLFINKKYDTICAAIHFSFTIDHAGNVYPCTSFLYKLGNVKEKSIAEIWNSSQELAYLRSIKKKDLTMCEKCEISEFCERCPGNALLEDDNLLCCDQMAKIIANARYDIYRR